jgi:chemotaxis protein MotA
VHPGELTLNLWKITAFVLSIGVLAVTLMTAGESPRAFLDLHGLLIVFGGTIAATAVSFQIPKIFLLLKIFWSRSVLGKDVDYQSTIRTIIQISEAFSAGSDNLRALVKGQQDPFLREGFEALLDNYADPENLHKILRRRADSIYDHYVQDSMRFKSIGKYPPAMGLLGAVTGMIALLASLGKPGVEKTVGPAMSVALVATMYGIALANFFIIPIADSLSENARELRLKNVIICEGIRLTSMGLNSLLLAEELNSFLIPSKRINWREPGK